MAEMGAYHKIHYSPPNILYVMNHLMKIMLSWRELYFIDDFYN